MKIREKIFGRVLLLCVLAVAGNGDAMAQLDLKNDTLECPIIGFSVGMMAPSNALSKATAANGSAVEGLRMSDLYSAPWMNVGLDVIYKFKSNWLATLEGDLWFGLSSNNLQHRLERMGNVFTRDSIVVGEGGTDANVTCYNRGLSFQAGAGKIFPLNPERNPNSGILARVSAGYMWQQTIFMKNSERAPQLTDDYALLYDHQRHGVLLTEGIGYWFMSARSDLANVYVAFEVSQCWSWSTRQYQIDHYLGLQGKDNNRYFDLLYSIKVCWMFPLRGKTVHDYYFY